MNKWTWLYLGKVFETIRVLAWITITMAVVMDFKFLAMWWTHEAIMTSGFLVEGLVCLVVMLVMFLVINKVSITIIEESKEKTKGMTLSWIDLWGVLSRTLSVVFALVIWYVIGAIAFMSLSGVISSLKF